MSSLSSREIESFKSSCYDGAKVEYTYQGNPGSGKVSGRGFMGGVNVQGVLSHVISDHGLSSGMYSSLSVDGKKFI
jgi:hypothetical protein